MIKVFSVAQMVAAEKAADASGVSYDQMMETAGKAVAEAMIARYPITDRKITILVGPGNNGGDGLVAGRYLAEAGADVAFYLFKARDADEDHNLAKVQDMGLLVLTADFDQRYRVLRSRLNITDYLMDALLGTGVSRPIGGNLAKLMKQVQAGLQERADTYDRPGQAALVSIAKVADLVMDADHPIPSPGRPIVVAVDCPSGLNCDNGILDPLAFPADLTVTFAGPKRGHFVFPGAGACGELVVADIGISPALPEVDEVKVELITFESARSLLPSRPLDGHKGTFGWVMIAAGSARYWGAAALAGRAAYRTGAGLVALAVPSSIRPALATQLPEATFPLISEQDLLGSEAAKALQQESGTYQAFLVGPGLHEAGEFMKTLLDPRSAAHLGQTPSQLPPMVIDADGLNLLALMDEWPGRLPANTILTPHPGEMARLMGVSLAELRSHDRVNLVTEMAGEWNCVVLLKGAYTVVGAPDGRCTIVPFANPVLATAGSGDVLSGVIVALLGQGLPPFESAILGGYLHGAAGQMAATDAGLLASEIADWLPEVRERFKE